MLSMYEKFLDYVLSVSSYNSSNDAVKCAEDTFKDSLNVNASNEKVK